MVKASASQAREEGGGWGGGGRRGVRVGNGVKVKINAGSYLLPKIRSSSGCLAFAIWRVALGLVGPVSACCDLVR